MKPFKIFTILGLSFLSALVIRAFEINTYMAEIENVTTTICDLVHLRAQGGATRDVFDSAYSYIKKHSPDPDTGLEINYSGKSIGSISDEKRKTSRKLSCSFDELNEYKLNFYFAQPVLFSFELLIWLGRIFILFTLLAFLQQMAFRFLKEFWSNELIDSIRIEFGLGSTSSVGVLPNRTHSVFGRMIGHWIATPLGSVKESIDSLKQSLDLKQSELQANQVAISEFEKESEKAKAFESKVKMARHDLRGPLSTMKLAVYNKSTVEEVMPGLIHLVDRIINDLETSPDVGDNFDVSAEAKLDLIEVMTRSAIKANDYILKNNSDIEFNYREVGEYLSPVKIVPVYWQRIIGNLLHNAVEAFGSCHQAANGSKQISICVERQTDDVLIKVKDTGPGIPPEILPSLFSKGATFGKKSGNGLGLHFVKTCIESWNGKITVDSKPGVGTEFTISLPLEVKYRDLFVPAQAINVSDGMIWLDDECTEQISLWGENKNKVEVFESPFEFIDWWNDGGNATTMPLVVDLHLGEHVSGVDVLRTIRGRPNTFLATSDYLDAGAMVAASQLGIRIVPKQCLCSTSSL